MHTGFLGLLDPPRCISWFSLHWLWLQVFPTLSPVRLCSLLSPLFNYCISLKRAPHSLSGLWLSLSYSRLLYSFRHDFFMPWLLPFTSPRACLEWASLCLHATTTFPNSKARCLFPTWSSAHLAIRLRVRPRILVESLEFYKSKPSDFNSMPILSEEKHYWEWSR